MSLSSLGLKSREFHASLPFLAITIWFYYFWSSACVPLLHYVDLALSIDDMILGVRRDRFCKWNYTVLKQRVAAFRGYGLTRVPHSPEVIVSLTSIPKRIADVPVCLYSIFGQRYKPDRVILTLSRVEFRNATVPPHVLEWQNRGLTINWADEDIRQYLKLLPVLRAYPESLIITVDDDSFYQSSIVESLVNSYRQNPRVIHAHRTSLVFPSGDSISFSGFGSPDTGSYKRFPLPNTMLIAEGIGAVLYPPHIFPSEIFNKSLFLQLVPWHDDIWFFAMRLLTGVSVQIVPHYDSRNCPIPSSAAVPYPGLAFWNWALRKNAEQVSAVGDAYKLGPRLARLRIEERIRQNLPEESWEAGARKTFGSALFDHNLSFWPTI